LEEEKAILEGMVESRDELLMEISRETGLGRMGEDEDDEEEKEDVDDGGDAAAPLLPRHHLAQGRGTVTGAGASQEAHCDGGIMAMHDVV
jgi:hypothetical protein